MVDSCSSGVDSLRRHGNPLDLMNDWGQEELKERGDPLIK
jgi:hypothetical protein